MAEQTVDFWPDIATAARRVTPLSLMKQQAVLLGKHTKNLLEGEVSSSVNVGRLVHRFQISVPTLDYSYELFRVMARYCCLISCKDRVQHGRPTGRSSAPRLRRRLYGLAEKSSQFGRDEACTRQPTGPSRIVGADGEIADRRGKVPRPIIR